MKNKRILIFLFSIVSIILLHSCVVYAVKKDYPTRQNYSILSDELKVKYSDVPLIYTPYVTSVDFPLSIEKNEQGKYGVFDIKNKKMLVPFEYDYLEQCALDYTYHKLFFYAKNDKADQIIDYKNNIIYKSNQYKFYCDRIYGILTENSDKKLGIVTFEGNEITKPIYDSISQVQDYSKNGRFAYIVSKDKKYGVLNYEGKVIIPIVYDQIYHENANINIFIVKKNNKYGVKSIYNDIIIPIEYDNIISDSHVLSTYFKLIKGTKKGIASINGKIEFPLSEVEDIDKLSDGYFVKTIKEDDELPSINNKYLIDSNGNLISKQGYSEISKSLSNENYFLIKKENINCYEKCKKKYSNKFIDDIEYKKLLKDITSKLSKVDNTNDMYKVLKRNSRKVIKILQYEGHNEEFYELYGDCSDKCSAVNNLLYGVIDKNGKEIVTPRKNISFTYASDKGLVSFSKGDNSGIFYKDSYLLKPNYYLIYLDKGYFIIQKNPSFSFHKNDNEYVYILTEDELIESKENLRNKELYNYKTLYYINEKCFRIYPKNRKYADAEKIFCER